MLLFVYYGLFVCLVAIFGLLLSKNNIILVLIAIELMLLGVNIILIVSSVFLDDIVGQVFAVFILCGAGSEAAIGLALLIIYYRFRGVISSNFMPALKG